MSLRYLYSIFFTIIIVLASYGLEKSKDNGKSYKILILNVFINKIQTGDQVVYTKKKIFMYQVQG